MRTVLEAGEASEPYGPGQWDSALKAIPYSSKSDVSYGAPASVPPPRDETLSQDTRPVVIPSQCEGSRFLAVLEMT